MVSCAFIMVCRSWRAGFGNCTNQVSGTDKGSGEVDGGDGRASVSEVAVSHAVRLAASRYIQVSGGRETGAQSAACRSSPNPS